MISRRNYLTITIVMFIVFFLFQFSNVALESWNHYEENSYIVDTAELPNKSDAYGLDGGGVFDDTRETVVYIGKEKAAVGETVSLWAVYTKKTLESYPTLEDYEEARDSDGAAPLLLAIDAAVVDWSEESCFDCLEACVHSGTHLVFCNLPSVSVLKETPRLQALLGIRTIMAEEMAVEDVCLHKGFLLGGETVYAADGMEEGIEFTMPWYAVSEDSEIYMNGVPKKKALGSEPIEDWELPAVIWRNKLESASVFAVNGSYMDDVAGLGILSAMSAKMNTYEIYPVVNAQNMIYVNYPGLADENSEVMMDRYSQSTESFFQNVVWPDLVAIRRESGAALSCMLAPQFDYEDSVYPETRQFQRYMKLLNEQKAETGLSGTCISDTPLEKKLARDHEFMQEALPTYQFTSFYAADMEEEEIWNALQEDLLSSVRTIIEDCNDRKEVFGYLSEYITRQSAVIDGFEGAMRHDFRIRCLETAVGYTSIQIDMGSIIYAEPEDAGWVESSRILRENIQAYRIGKQGFANTTVSECDERIRSFLALDYSEKREFNSIRLEVNDVRQPVWFVLRTHGEAIERVEGGSWEKLEDDVFLINVEQKTVSITLKSF